MSDFFSAVVPWIVAVVTLLGVLALAGFLALYYAVAALLMCKVAPRSPLGQALVFAAAGAVVELVWQDDMAGGVLFLERAAGGDGDDEAYAE